MNDHLAPSRWFAVATAALALAACDGVHLEDELTARGDDGERLTRGTPPLPAGDYDVRSVIFDETSETYGLLLASPPVGFRPLFQSPEVKVVRLTDEELAAGTRTYVRFAPTGAATLHLGPELEIAVTKDVAPRRSPEPKVAQGGSRTLTPLRIVDFESTASAIPPPGQGRAR